MSISFSGSELINIAIGIERRGTAFYEVMARSTKNAVARDVFLYLVHHLEWHDRSGDVSRARRSIVRWFLSCGRKIWVNSLSTANDVVSLGIREEKLCIIPPGFERFELAPGSRLQQPVRILSVGAICPRKDQLTLVKACAGLGNTDFHLLILGDETVDAGYAEVVRREADRDSLRGKVTFMGHISQDDLHRMYNQCHILANLSPSSP